MFKNSTASAAQELLAVNSHDQQPGTSKLIAHISQFEFDPNVDAATDETIFDGFLSAADLVIWAGREKHRKSSLVLQIAVCAAVGRDFLGMRFVAPTPLAVTVFDFETKQGSLKRRFDSLVNAMSLTNQEAQALRQNLKIVLIREIARAGASFPRFPAVSPRQGDRAANDEAKEFWRQLIAHYPSSIYILDPMRSVHTSDENDSAIEQFLESIRKIFGKAAVIIAHHMRKSGGNPASAVPLRKDQRRWSDDIRGSGAIKAHCDVLVCQEREVRDGEEIVYWGCFAKDWPDVEPFPVCESDIDSFYWKPERDVPDHLEGSYEALIKAGGRFLDRAAAVRAVRTAGTKKTTAHRHVIEMVRRGLLVEGGNGLHIADESAERSASEEDSLPLAA